MAGSKTRPHANKSLILAPYRDFAKRVRAQFDATVRNPSIDRVYRMFMHEGLDGGLGVRIVVWTKRVHLMCLIVSSHNMSRTAIDSQPDLTAANLMIDGDGAIVRFSKAPATEHEVARFVAAWPETKELLLNPVKPKAAKAKTK